MYLRDTVYPVNLQKIIPLGGVSYFAKLSIPA